MRRPQSNLGAEIMPLDRQGQSTAPTPAGRQLRRWWRHGDLRRMDTGRNVPEAACTPWLQYTMLVAVERRPCVMSACTYRPAEGGSACRHLHRRVAPLHSTWAHLGSRLSCDGHLLSLGTYVPCQLGLSLARRARAGGAVRRGLCLASTVQCRLIASVLRPSALHLFCWERLQHQAGTVGGRRPHRSQPWLAMGLLDRLIRRAWLWRPGTTPPPPGVLAAAAAALRQLGAKAADERDAVLQQLASLADPEAAQQGREAAAAAAAAMASDGELLEAVAQAVHPSARPSEPAVEASSGSN